MDLEQAEARRIVEKLLRISGLAPTQLARKAGLAPSTLNRFLNTPNVKHTLSFKTIKKLTQATGTQLTVESTAGEASPPATPTVTERLITAFASLPDDEQQFMLVACEFRAQQMIHKTDDPPRRSGTIG